MIRNANDAIEYIHSLHRFEKKAGLSNITQILDRLQNPQKGMKFVHVAGTNGKGSVSNIVKNILMSHGYKVGYYTSPYIELFSERICIGNCMISDDDLVYYTNEVKKAICGLNPIEFEFITAMAMLYFKHQKCDVIVLEVGLGGRFDATNVIDSALVSVITSIGLDHTAILGETLPQIAFEKAGIIKKESNVVVGHGIDEESMEVIRRRCVDTDSEMILPGDLPQNVRYTKEGTHFSYKDVDYFLSLPGTYQLTNAVTAIETANILKRFFEISDEDIKTGLATSFWKCRFEIVSRNPVVVLDGAHNSHGVKALMDSVELYFKDKRKVFLFSMLSEKDWQESIDMISSHCDAVVVTTVPSVRKTDSDEMYNILKMKVPECHINEDYIEAFSLSKQIAGEDGAVFAFGSLYLAGALRRYEHS